MTFPETNDSSFAFFCQKLLGGSLYDLAIALDLPTRLDHEIEVLVLIEGFVICAQCALRQMPILP